MVQSHFQCLYALIKDKGVVSNTRVLRISSLFSAYKRILCDLLWKADWKVRKVGKAQLVVIFTSNQFSLTIIVF